MPLFRKAGRMNSKPRGLQVYVSNNRLYVYDRKSHTRIHSEPGSAEFLAELATIRRQHPVFDQRSFLPGSLGQEVAIFIDSEQFRALPLSVRASARRVIDSLRPIATIPLQNLNRSAVLRVRDRIKGHHGYRYANVFITVISAALAYAALQRKITENPIDLATCRLAPQPSSRSSARRAR